MSKKKHPFIHKESNDTDVEDYLPLLTINDSISHKMNELYKTSVLSKHDITKREKILGYIHSLFTHFYPDCSLVAFGSSINGFGTKGCDLDLMFSPCSDYVNLVAPESDDDDENVPTMRDVKTNPSVVSTLKYLSREKQLRFLLRVLRYNKHKFREAIYIPAKCPIVRFFTTHEHYQLWCDLSFQQGLPKFNSELLHSFSIADSRVKPLMVTLRFWAKHLNIIGSGAFSSYAFSLLIVFFLQNVELPILPPVNDLMINAESCIVDGWEAGFVSDAVQNFVSKNTLSEEQLLKEFFRFYWNFDFTRNVACIRIGKEMPISDIRKDTDERMQNFVVSDVCVQDPFNLSHNVASSIKLVRFHLLKPYFFIANLILSNQLHSSEYKDVFELLFKKELYENKIQELFHFRKTGGSESFYLYPNCETIATLGYHVNIWREQVCKAVRDILEYVFFFDCEVIDKNYSINDTDPGDGYSEGSQEHSKPLLSIQCAVDNRVWKYRHTKINIPLDSYDESFTNEILKKENALSHFLLASTPALRSPEPFIWFLCNCYPSKYSQIPSIWIHLIPSHPRSPEFKSISKVLKGFIPKTVENLLMDDSFSCFH